MMNDAELLRNYVECRSETAFADLVGRHVNLVYSTALRVVRDAALAEDVVQSVFLQLAQKAATVRDGRALPGWLYRVTHCQAANAVRAEKNRRRCEAEALKRAELEAESTWEQIEFGLENAMNTLSPDEQNLMVMRFFQDRSWRDVSTMLAVSEDTVQRRAGRALEKLRKYFARQGIAASATAIAMALAANSIQAAPGALASTVTAASLAGTTSSNGVNLLTISKIVLMKKAVYTILAVAIIAAISLFFIVAKSGHASRAVTAESLRKGMILNYSFDNEEADGTVADLSSAHNNGKVSGARWIAGGKRGGAYEFTTDGDEIQVPNNASLNPAQITLAAWFKTSVTDDRWRRIFDKSYSKGFALSIAADWQGNQWAGLGSLEMGPGTHFKLTKAKVADGEWHQMVATFDGNDEWLYLDGRPQGQPVRWNIPGRLGATDFNLVIGCNRSNLTEDDLGTSFRGLIDEPMVWNRALSSNEVAFLFYSQKQ